MVLHDPFKISARLLPALQFGAGWISWDGTNFIVDLDGKEYVIDDYRPGAFHQVQSVFADILCFLSYAGEEVSVARRTGHDPFKDPTPDACATLFAKEISEWAANHYDDMSCLSQEIEEGNTLFIKD